MPVKTKIQKRKAKNIISTPSKINLWLRAFLDETNPRTFMNRVESVKAAGYRCASEEAFRAMGSSVYQRCQSVIAGWLDEVGLSEPSLKLKALSLLSARETKFEKIKGTVDPETLPAHVSVLTTTDITTSDPETGEVKTLSGDTLLGIEVNALETQRKTLDMAFRVRGMYAPEKHAVIAKGELNVTIQAGPEVRALIDGLAESIFGQRSSDVDKGV